MKDQVQEKIQKFIKSYIKYWYLKPKKIRISRTNSKVDSTSQVIEDKTLRGRI